MKRVAASSGVVALLLASGLALSACVATVPEPYYAGPPAYYSYAPGYYYAPARPSQTFVFSYRDYDRRGPYRHRHWR